MSKRLALTISVLTALVAFAMLTWSLSFAQVGQGYAQAGLDGVTNLPARQPESPDDWYGVWQFGDLMTASVWGGPANEGLARFSGHYYEATYKIYFLGGRRENNDTTGVIFSFTPNTGVYASTGVTIPNPVSNYIISQIDNDGQGNGPGLYMVAGRLNNGTNSNLVQVYYPDTNTAQTIATDPIPGSPRAVGGQAVVNGKLYAFGGFDAAIMYDETYVYDPQATAGTRWSNTNCDLPTARSYIATAVVGTKIYAIGGDLFDGAALIPITDTVVLDTANLGNCWQDGDMADLPAGFANGDAPAVYINEGYLDGGIYVAGGSWPAPGPFNWVFRYDVAGDSWDVAFPVLNQARRNYALVYVPASACACESLGDGIPGMWAFGGYDGTAANAMTESSEFFSIEGTDVFLFPDAVEKAGVAGTSVQFNMVVLNDTANAHTYDVTYSQAMTWSVTAPTSVGPVAAGAEAFFPVTIDLPAEADCPTTNTITVTVEAQDNSSITDSQDIGARVACGVGGTVYDANNSEPIASAYIWMEDTADPLNTFYETYTNISGDYALIDIPPATYRLYASALGYQGSFYPSGWPTGAVTITLSTNTVLHDFDLAGSEMDWAAAGLDDVTAAPGETVTHTLWITNNGTGPLAFSLNLLDGPPPQADQAPIAGLGRIDQQLYRDFDASPDGTADFVVMLKDQADLNAAYQIADWQTRGQYVYDTLRQHAQFSQASLRQTLSSQGVDYRPLYIVNGLIVRSGNLALVEGLAARPDVAQIIANRQIPVEAIPSGWLDRLMAAAQLAAAPTTVEWNIARINADDVWTDYTRGEGIVVANIDTGVQYNHPALSRQYRGWDGVGYDHDYNWWDPYHQGPGGGTTPADVNGHGTHVMGTMVGEDAALTNQIGAAPGARWIACDGGDDASGFLLTNELLECAEWIIAPWDLAGQNPDPGLRPHVVNNSWGGSPNDYWYTGAVAAWRAAGIFPAFANGNDGPGCETSHSPGDYWNTFAAGASTNTDDIAGFSSRGPSSYHGLLKPDITAPGASVRSSVPSNSYALFSGTSMASPHVAGSIALLWSANPELIGQIDLTAQILQLSADPQTTDEGCGGDGPADVPNHTFGYGILDIHAAVALAQGGTFTPTWLTVDPLGGVVAPGDSMAVNVVFHAPVTEGVYTATIWLTANDPYNRSLYVPVQLTVEEPQTEWLIYLPAVIHNTEE